MLRAILGGEIIAIVPFDAFADVQNIGFCVVTNAPAFQQLSLESGVVVIEPGTLTSHDRKLRLAPIKVRGSFTARTSCWMRTVPPFLAVMGRLGRRGQAKHGVGGRRRRARRWPPPEIHAVTRHRRGHVNAGPCRQCSRAWVVHWSLKNFIICSSDTLISRVGCRRTKRQNRPRRRIHLQRSASRISRAPAVALAPHAQTRH